MTLGHFLQRRLDRAGIVLSGLCALHCVATIVLVSVLGVGSQFLLEPAIHEAGLVLAAIVAALAIGWSALQHRRPVPLLIGVAGLGFMGAAMGAPHGLAETGLTMIGVGFVAVGHLLNLRHAR